jgi:hypothetical protein
MEDATVCRLWGQGCERPNVASFLATLGRVMESQWDSGKPTSSWTLSATPHQFITPILLSVSAESRRGGIEVAPIFA